MNTLHVDVVSAEESIFSGQARFVALPGEAGELGILPKHTPLITRIKPGSVRIEMADGSEEFVFVAGGILEVQPDCVTVLSDTAIRGHDLDDQKAQEAKAAAEEALKNAMRQDPDVIFIGEIRDYQTMQAAFSAAQTGHLVLSTLHTASAVESLIRIEGLFKKQQQDAIRLELSLILRGIITQKLLPQRNGGRVCAMEILTATDAVRSLIAAGQPQQIMSVIQTSKKDGMQTMEMSLSKLRQEKIIY